MKCRYYIEIMTKVENNIIEPLIVAQTGKIISKHSEKHINKTISRRTHGVEYLKLLGWSNMAAVSHEMGLIVIYLFFNWQGDTYKQCNSLIYGQSKWYQISGSIQDEMNCCIPIYIIIILYDCLSKLSIIIIIIIIQQQQYLMDFYVYNIHCLIAFCRTTRIIKIFYIAS